MIAALAQLALPDALDFDSLAAAIAGCNRPAVTATVDSAGTRHSRFLLDAYREQRGIAIARVDLAERRRRLRAKEAKIDTEEGLRIEGEALDERARALTDARALDQSEQDMIGYFRTQYLRQCSGKGL